MLTQTVNINKLSFSHGILIDGQFAEQYARDVERRVFESENSSNDYVIEMWTIDTKLGGFHSQEATSLFATTIHNTFSIQYLDPTSMTSSPLLEEPGEDPEHLMGEEFLGIIDQSHHDHTIFVEDPPTYDILNLHYVSGPSSGLALGMFRDHEILGHGRLLSAI